MQDIEAVLQSVADVLLPDFPRHRSISIDVRSSAAGPRVLAIKSSEGSHQVLLNVQGARWDQLAYQFSHELCHIVSNYDRREIGSVPALRGHQWFEETLCEAVSLMTLDRLTSKWEQSPPVAGWQDYAGAFRNYAQRLLSDPHRHLPHSSSFAAWYRENERALEEDPYLREKNELAAVALRELLENTPGSLAAIGYLNLESSGRGSFAAYLASWYDCCPEAHRPFVLRLMSLFNAA